MARDRYATAGCVRYARTTRRGRARRRPDARLRRSLAPRAQLRDRGADTANPLRELLAWHGRYGETKAVVSAGRRIERFAEEERGAEAFGRVDQRTGAHLARGRGPDVEAAHRAADAHPRGPVFLNR